LEAVFVLLEFSSPSRRIFIGSHSLPPSLVRHIGPSSPVAPPLPHSLSLSVLLLISDPWAPGPLSILVDVEPPHLVTIRPSSTSTAVVLGSSDLQI
jgi:hypothetical protein